VRGTASAMASSRAAWADTIVCSPRFKLQVIPRISKS
jgi:hypothetical protein